MQLQEFLYYLSQAEWEKIPFFRFAKSDYQLSIVRPSSFSLGSNDLESMQFYIL